MSDYAYITERWHNINLAIDKPGASTPGSETMIAIDPEELCKLLNDDTSPGATGGGAYETKT